MCDSASRGFWDCLCVPGRSGLGWRRMYLSLSSFLPDFLCMARECVCMCVCVDGERLLFLVSCLSKAAAPAAKAQQQRLPHNAGDTSQFIQAEESMWRFSAAVSSGR